MKAKTKKEPTWDEIGKAIGSKMEKGCDEPKKNWFSKGCCSSPGSGGAIYGLGFLGALVYFVTTAPDFWGIIIGIIKSIFWPGVIVYGVLKFFGM
ncbi:MAG: hypothetical protein WC462_03065 [archaeon]